MPRPKPPTTPAEIDHPNVVDLDAHRRDEEAAAETQRGGEHRLARSAFLDPAPQNRRRQAEHEDADVKIQPSSVSFQSSGADWVMPMSLVIGRLNTLKA